MLSPGILILSGFLTQVPRQEVVIRGHPYIPPPANALTVETNLVESLLVVRDNRGKPLGGFKAADFEVLDNGKREEILSFLETKPVEASASAAGSPKGAPAVAKPTAPPAKVVTLFFDDLHTESAPLLRAVGAARKFLSTAIEPEDRIAIATSSATADLDFTNDSTARQEKLDHLRTHVRPPLTSCPVVSSVEAYLFLKGTDAAIKQQAINDARVCICGPAADPSCLNSKATTMAAPGVAGSAAETVWGQAEIQSNNAMAALGDAARRLAAANGERVMVLISTGFLPPLQRQLDSLITAAMRWNIIIHSLDAKSLDAEREGLNGTGFNNLHVDRTQLPRQTAVWEPLEKLSQGTGGHFFHNTNDLAGAIQMAARPAIVYLLSFNPGERDGQFHNLKISFKAKSPYSVQFRPGYYSPPDAKKDPTSRAAMDAAVFSKQKLTDIPSAVSLAAGQPKDGAIPLSVVVTLDIRGLEFKIDNGRHVQQIVFLMTLLDAGGTFVTGKEAVMELALTDEKLASLQKEGLKAVATLDAPPGIYQVRTIIREAMQGKLGASTIPVDLRAR